MRNVSNLNLDVIFELIVSLLVIAHNFIFLPTLEVPNWQPCHHSWIINEERVNLKNGCHIRTSHVIISHCTIFHLPTYSVSSWLTICHQLWIINEERVNFKNGCHIRTSRVIISHCTKFHLPIYSRSAWLTTLSSFMNN